MLYGRSRECDALDQLLAAARSGHSGVLVLRGEPGMGKTALLLYAVRSASGFRVARAVGVESERELAFATLQQLCAPLLDALDELPDIQRDALRAAFGLRAAKPPQRFLVGLAALSLCSAAGEEKPLLCVVDDAQWLDRESAQAVAFVARRLLADPVALLLATRERNGEFSGLPELIVGGLDDEDARGLLKASMPAPVSERVRDRIVAETQGNPLALLELPRGLTPSQLAAGFTAPAAVSLSGRIEDSFRRRVEQLPVDAQRLLLVAAAEPVGEPTLVWDAARRLGVGNDAAAPAAAAGLLDIDSRVVFRHPLVRSAIYRAASSVERREVHRALADATDRQLDPDRRAWHLAEAAQGPDDDVAAALERSAGRAEQRGGQAAAAAFLERSAELSVAPQRRAQRLLAAAGAHLAAGAFPQARALVEQGASQLVDPAGRARSLALEGAIRFADGRGGETPSLLLEAARALGDVDRRMARETLLAALEAALWAGQLTTGTTVFDVAEAARAMPAEDEDDSTANLLLRGYTEQFTNSYAAAVGWWRRAAEQDLTEVDEAPHQWQGMVWNATGHVLDFEGHAAAARKWLRQARTHGALSTLGHAFNAVGWTELLSGRGNDVERWIVDALEIAAATGAPSFPGAEGISRLALLSWSGREEEARQVAEAVMAGAFVRGQGLGVSLAHFFLTKLELSLGRYDEARIHALAVFEQDPSYTGTMALGDIVEATVRAGDTESARAALARLSERAEASGAPWGLGLLARARALLAEDCDAETLYEQSLAQLARSGVATELARSRLLYGEWLRRHRRRRDARVQLRAAHAMFMAMDAEAWAKRAGVEVGATGEHARPRVSETRDELTAQERHVAQLAAAGESNAEIAAELFISRHTVAYHLRKVFVKLGISSRNQLARALSDNANAPALTV
jgi:DNA-binding CsgD family transcriptional regulator/tetratricopeptide (TPR) repeat protein